MVQFLYYRPKLPGISDPCWWNDAHSSDRLYQLPTGSPRPDVPMHEPTSSPRARRWCRGCEEAGQQKAWRHRGLPRHEQRVWDSARLRPCKWPMSGTTRVIGRLCPAGPSDVRMGNPMGNPMEMSMEIPIGNPIRIPM